MDIEKPKTNPSRARLVHLWNSVHGIVNNLCDGDSKCAEEHENRIRRHYNWLLSHLNVPDVVTQMYQREKLTQKDHEHLRQFYSNPIEASEELLKIVIERPRHVYDSFIDVLKKTKQHHVYKMLTSDEEDACLDDQPTSEHSRIIRQNYDFLIEKLDLDSGLLSNLYARQVLSHREYYQMLYEKDPTVKNETLLSIISRKSVEDYNKFRIALNDTGQRPIYERLTKTLIANKQSSTSPSTKPMVVKSIPETDPSKQNRMEKRENVQKHKLVASPYGMSKKKRSVEYLEGKVKQLAKEYTELQTEVSTKKLLIHQSSSTAINPIWMISITKILEESRNVKEQNILQAKNADKRCVRLLQEINGTNKLLAEKKETVCDLKDRLSRVENENKNLLRALKAGEIKVENIMALNEQKKNQVRENESKIEKLDDEVRNYETRLKEMETQLKDTKEKLSENDTFVKQTRPTTKLDEAQEMLKDTITKKNESEAKLAAIEKRLEDLTVLNEQKDKQVRENESKIEKLDHQIKNYETRLKETEELLKDTAEKLAENDAFLKQTTTKLDEAQEMLKETITKKNESEAKLKVTQKRLDDLTVWDLWKKRQHILQELITKNNESEEKLAATEKRLGDLAVLSQQKEKQARENESKIEKLADQKRNYETRINETESRLKDTTEKLAESETFLKQTTTKLDEAQKMLKETITKKNESEAKLAVTEKRLDDLTVLNEQKDKLVRENESKIEKLDDQIRNYETRFKEAEELLKDTTEKLSENDTFFKQTRTKLDEAQEMLKKTINTKNESEAKLTVTEKRLDDLTVLNQRLEQDMNEKVKQIEMLQNLATQHEEQLKQMKAELVITESMYKKNEFDFNSVAARLKDSEEKLKESETKLSDSEARLKVAEKAFDNLKSEGEVRSENNSHLRLLGTIPKNRSTVEKRKLFTRTEASAEKGNKSIKGLTIIDKELFVISSDSSEVDVYDSMELCLLRRWKLKNLIDPKDMVACCRNKCLYIIDAKFRDRKTEMFRVDPNGKLIQKWPTEGDYGRLSVTYDSTVILVDIEQNKLNEYSPDGQLIREIHFSSEEGFCHPWHAIKLTNGHFVVSHGYYDDVLHRVCIVDADGKLLKSFGGKPGSTIQQTHYPYYLSVGGDGFVMVADRENSRVMLLDSDLKLKREILTHKMDGLQRPERILLDEFNGRLFVADNEWDNQRISIFDLK